MEALLQTLQGGYGRIEMVRASTGLAAWFGLLNQLRAESHATGGDTTARVLAAADWARSRLIERITVADMAHLAGLSPSHFSTLFRRRFGYSPLDFHLRCRVQRSCELLAAAGITVTQAAAATGFEDPHYFSRVFRSIMGEPPSTYAERHQTRTRQDT